MIFQKIAFFLVLWVAAIPAYANSDTYPKNPNIDILHYAFDLTLTDNSDVVVGITTIDVRFLAAGELQLRLDLMEDREGKGMTVDWVRMGDADLVYRHEEEQLFIDLPQAPAAGERIRVTVGYHGTPANGLKIAPNKHGDRTFFSDNWPNKARHWLPTVDHPYDKATSEMRVTAPAHYQVISNGLLIEETDLGDGNRVTHWKQSVPIATWLYVLGAARFAVQRVDTFEGKEIQTWVYYQDRDAGFYDFAVPTKAAMAYYDDKVGPFSYEKLANIQSNSVGGGMEAATAIFYGDNSVTGDRSRRWQNVIIHEVAHQWFGNAVTEYDWDDVWLSEGFATYFTLLFREHYYGRDDFVEGLKDASDRIYEFYKDRYDYRIVHDNLDDMSQVTTRMTYQKGAWILHMLRERIGVDAFWQGIQTYYAEFQDLNATTADFRRHMEEAAGEDLEWFFDQWLYQGGVVYLEGYWDYSDGELALHVAQTQMQYRFRITISFDIVYEDGSTERISFDIEGDAAAGFKRKMEKRVVDVIPDPETQLLARWSFRGP